MTSRYPAETLMAVQQIVSDIEHLFVFSAILPQSSARLFPTFRCNALSPVATGGFVGLSPPKQSTMSPQIEI